MESTSAEGFVDSDDEFQDAQSNITNEDNHVELSRAIAEVNLAISLFFNNQFIEAKKLTAERSNSSMYHSIGYSTLLFLEAAMTFEAKDIVEAMASIKTSIQFCNQFRRKQNIAVSVGKMLGLATPADLTEEEKHAELIFAELNLFRAALTFIQDENLISFIRGALKIRLGYQTYNYCLKLSDKMEPTKNNMHFIGGVLLGCGSFNIGLSLLPPRILSLLEWIGFTSDKHKGMEQLTQGYTDSNLRSSLISLFILSYNLFLTVHLGTNDADLPGTEKILRDMLKRFPEGVFFHLYAGRLEQLKGNFDFAIPYLEKAVVLQTQWKPFSHICYWELMWCHAFKFNWLEAAKYASLLRKESNWSKCVYTYLRASFLVMVEGNEYQEEIDSLLREVPKLKQRFAGKSIPIEKFVARKSRKYFEQGRFLMLPAHEMLYCWNGLLMLKGNAELREKHLDLVTEAFRNLEERKERSATSTDEEFHYFDDHCLLQLLKGTLLRYSSQPKKAELCFNDVKEKYKCITKDHYIAPAALADLVWILIEQGRHEEASDNLKHIRKTYSHYSMESRLQFRMHAAQSWLNENSAKASISKT